MRRFRVFWAGLRPGLSRFKAFSPVFCAADAWLRVELLPDSASLKIENEEERWFFAAEALLRVELLPDSAGFMIEN